MSAATMDARPIYRAVEGIAPYLSAPELQRTLREFAISNGVPWDESDADDTRISPEAAALMTELADRIASTVTSYLRVRQPRTAYIRDERPCPEPACKESVHEWLNGERSEACALEPIVHVDGWFRVHAGKSPGEDLWEVWVDAADLPDGVLLDRAMAGLADGIAQMQQRVDVLNAAGIA